MSPPSIWPRLIQATLRRAARLVAQNAVDPSLPGLGDVIDKLVAATFDAATATPYEAAIRRAEERVLVDRLQWLATSAQNAEVRAIASLKLQRLADRMRETGAKTDADIAQHTLMAADIKRFLERPMAEGAEVMPTQPAPPGAPIGDSGYDWLARPIVCDWEDQQM